MNRRVTNLIRTIMDEWLPPIVRDNRWFMWPLFQLAYRGRDVPQLMELKHTIWDYTPAQYKALYSGLDSISRNRPTDLNKRCIDALTDAITDADIRILDVGCGSGFLARHLAQTLPGRTVSALDVVPPHPPLPEHIDFLEADIGTLTLEPNSVDVITCCHVLEHLLDYRDVMAELVSAARHRVIFVVPRQRPFFYTLDEHVNFFLFPEKFAYEVGLDRYRVEVLDGDLFYVGETTP